MALVIVQPVSPAHEKHIDAMLKRDQLRIIHENERVGVKSWWYQNQTTNTLYRRVRCNGLTWWETMNAIEVPEAVAASMFEGGN